jgi:cell shape-determining protein MreC
MGNPEIMGKELIPVDSSITTGLIGFIGGTITVLFGFWTQRRKSDIDESALVLGKWKELVDQHQQAIKDIREEFSEYKRTALFEIAELRERLAEAENRIRELETENAGLKRAIAQNSQSTATLLGSTPIRGSGGRNLEGGK